jgi:tRNA pseudouridine55 synthase
MNGILIIDKPLHLTSHDVVARVRRAAGQRKIGHAGTLDPLATGVLVLGLGKATRTIEYLTNDDKLYEAKVRLGQSTTTYDAEGEVVLQYEGLLPTAEGVESKLEQFRGAIMQKPPIFSAIKKGGEALYKKARRGETVKIEPRPITIYKLELTSWQPPDMGLTVHCSKGTYIRSLAHDLGAALGTGGHLVGLRRTASGSFTLADAYPLEDITTTTADQIQRLLKPLGTGLEAIPALTVDEATIKHIRHGRVLPATKGEGLRRILDQNGRLVAILQWRDGRGWQPKKVFIP